MKKYSRCLVMSAFCLVFVFISMRTAKSWVFLPSWDLAEPTTSERTILPSRIGDKVVGPTECMKCLIFLKRNYCTNPKAVASSSYQVNKIVKRVAGVKITLVKYNRTSGDDKYGTGLPILTVTMTADTHRRVHIKIVDNKNERWQIPQWLVPIPDDPVEMPLYPLYYIKYSGVGKPFHFSVIRRSNKDILFDTCGGKGLHFADQFLSIGTKLPKNYNVYGLGEHVVPSLRLPQRTYTLWNYDAATPRYNNLYGSHPFYLEHRSTGLSHGVFLRNSNGMDIVLDEKSLTYNVLGGVFDFYFFLGHKPESVIQQYQEVIGTPNIPPYWGLGFHQSCYGYRNIEELKTVVRRFREESIPLDTMWTDIDYMDERKVFTLNPVNFPESQMKEFVNDLHQNEQHYVVIIDPGIKIDNDYEPYKNGLQLDIFIKTSKGDIFKGQVWPGKTAFPDFMNPRTSEYWEAELTKFYNMLPIDGIWLDMNELSNFHKFSKVAKSKQNYPKYKINNQGLHQVLMKKTILPDAIHYGGIREYDIHNLYGHTETIITSRIFEKITGKRSFIITRSTFPGTGSYGGHWTGDNHATWTDLSQSVIDVLNFQLYSIPLVGADICGFMGDTTEELCARWIALGAFYPFSRSHSKQTAKPQELYLWKSVADVSRKVLRVRYSLLPYYYTLFYKVSIVTDNAFPSATVLRPLFFEFPYDTKTFNIYNQFMIGSSLLVTPALKKGELSVTAYFPESIWYDYHSLEKISEGQQTITLNAPLDHVQIHIRGGSILPTQIPSLTTAATRRNNLKLIVALDSEEFAYGELYWDDGESLKNDNYLLVHFIATKSTTTCTLVAEIYETQYIGDLPVIGIITVLGVQQKPLKVTIKDVDHGGFDFEETTGVLTMVDLDLSIGNNFIIRISS